MLAKTDKGNLAQVRSALEGITGVEHKPKVERQYRMVICRPNHEFDTVDSFRRHSTPAFWPNYEELIATRQQQNGQPVRRIRRVGIIAGYVFTPVDPDVDFMALLQRVVGAIEIVRTMSGAPLLLDEEDIQTLRRIEMGRNVPAKAVNREFKLGEKVRFTDDLQHRWPPGKIIKLARQGRIIVEISLMGRKVEVKALPHQIERT